MEVSAKACILGLRKTDESREDGAVKYTTANVGRIFVLRLEDGDVLNDTLEAFAREQGLRSALAFYVGGVAAGSKVVVGPDEESATGMVPLIHALQGVQEGFALGTLFPDTQGRPVLHMHSASGREGGATVGCTRAGLSTWLIGEVILLEITEAQARREVDTTSGFELLAVGPPSDS
jgi:predicted DNA-binding protein with PD1-like motif